MTFIFLKMIDNIPDTLKMEKCHLASSADALAHLDIGSTMDDDPLSQAALKLPVSTTHRESVSVLVDRTPGTESFKPVNRVRGFPTGPSSKNGSIWTYPSHEGPPEMLRHESVTHLPSNGCSIKLLQSLRLLK